MIMDSREERNLNVLMAKAKEMGIDVAQKVKIDLSKSYEENEKTILQAIQGENERKLKSKEKNANNKTKATKVVVESGEKKALEEKEREIRKKMMEEFNRTIERIKSNSSPEVDKYFTTVKELIKIVARQDINGMITYGETGLGKTYVCLKTLGELGLKVGEDFQYLSGHITPVELYNSLWKFRDKITVIDDVEGILDNKTMSILKSALWSSFDRRYVGWNSPTHFLSAPREFEFGGKIFLLMNRIPPKNEVLKSLLSRVLTYRLDFDHQTRIKVMYEISKLFKLDLEVVDYLKDRYTPALDSFNFRTLLQLNAIRQHYEQNPPSNGVSWKSIADELISQNTDPQMALVWQLLNSEKSVNEQVKEFEVWTGYSRRTFFRIKNRLLELESAKVPSETHGTKDTMEEQVRRVVGRHGEMTAEQIKQAVVGKTAPLAPNQPT